jgi:predicted PhzF superfamily epimerase YddE/YHI9
VELCGHATLAAAHVLWQQGHLDAAAAAQFLTRSGPLAATRDGDWITLDFPVTPVVPVAWPDGLVDVLGCTPVFVGRSMFDLLVLLDSEQAVRALHPALDRVRSYPYRGLIVTAPGERVDVVSRFFAPAVGVPEDPVTGSAHCALAPFWCERLQRDSLLCEQFSPHRGGQLRARLRGDRVALAGQAVTTARVQLLV